METTFITIHDLSPEARILYSSDSIVDILGYSPEEVVGQPCWDFFHPDEIPIARAKHGRGVELDKAAVLSYCRMRDKDGRWLGCEVVFTVVFDVVVGCTSIYRRGIKSQNRAVEAPVIRRLFSASPRDPRYHMLTHLSPKFDYNFRPNLHEPRAALFLNRYTRSLTIMYATNGLADLLGLNGEDMIGLSFYYCIQQSCYQDAVRCLETAKANDSIAYLRFLWQDPRFDESELDDKRFGSEPLGSGRKGRASRNTSTEADSQSTESDEPNDSYMANNYLDLPNETSHESSGDSNSSTHEAIFGEPEPRQSSASSMSNSPISEEMRNSRSPRRPIELEAVVSCTSDGLVVCLRKASYYTGVHASTPARQVYTNGLFAAPWARNPLLPTPSQIQPETSGRKNGVLQDSNDSSISDTSAYCQRDFMNSIRDAAVFAWALTSINGSLADYSRGQPRGEAQPANGLPVWQPEPMRQVQETTAAPTLPAKGGSHYYECTNNFAGAGNLTAGFQKIEGHSRPPAAEDTRAPSSNGCIGTNGSVSESCEQGTPRTSGFGFGDPGLDSK